MKGYAIGIPTIEMGMKTGGATDKLIQAAKGNKDFVGCGFNGELAMVVFKTKASATAAFMVARVLGFKVIAMGAAEYDL